MKSPKKIVIIGPESTGKSTLCEMLAKHFQTAWVPEYAREYLLTHGNAYSYTDLLTVAKGQLAGEENITAGFSFPNPVLFIDTDMYVMKVWCEFVFGKCHSWIIDRAADQEYDLYLLCNTDLPWIKDELREYPDHATREKLFHMYKDIMINQQTPWIEIRGNYEDRFKMAVNAVTKLLGTVHSPPQGIKA